MVTCAIRPSSKRWITARLKQWCNAYLAGLKNTKKKSVLQTLIQRSLRQAVWLPPEWSKVFTVFGQQMNPLPHPPPSRLLSAFAHQHPLAEMARKRGCGGSHPLTLELPI